MKEKLPLILGVGLPIVLIMYVLIAQYIPSFFASPRYNILYTKGCSGDYSIRVTHGKVNAIPRYTTPVTAPLDCFYVYNVKQDSSRQVTPEDVQTYTIDPSDKSSDGYDVSRNSGSGGFFPFMNYGSNIGYYLHGHGLNRQISDSTYDFQFIGWITN